MRIALLALLPLSIAGAQAEWAVSSKPILDVPGVDANGAEAFQNLAGAVRLSNGKIIIADKGSTSIRLLDEKGKLLRSVGRQGSGPGEYRIIATGSPCADSLVVWAVESTIMVGESGAAARQFKLPADNPRMAPLLGVSCAANGNFVYISQPAARSMTPAGLMQMKSAVIATDREGKILTQVDSIPSGLWMAVGGGGFPVPLGPFTNAVAVGDHIAVGVSDSARIWIISPSGKRTTIPVPYTPRAPTDQEMADAIDAVADLAPVQLRPRLLPELQKATKPAMLPAYFGIWGDPDGVLWVQQTPPGAKRTDLLAMSVDGKVIARTLIPMAAKILDIGRDYILASYDDANDETHLAVFSLRKR
jgi:hypothetical protein